MRSRKQQTQGSRPGLTPSISTDPSHQTPHWGPGQGRHARMLPAQSQGRGREVKGPSLGAQALSCPLPGRGRATVHMGSTPSPSCPGSLAVNLLAKGTCVGGSSKAAPQTRDTDPQETGLQQQLRPQQDQVILALPLAHTPSDLPHVPLSRPEAPSYSWPGLQSKTGVSSRPCLGQRPSTAPTPEKPSPSSAAAIPGPAHFLAPARAPGLSPQT